MPPVTLLIKPASSMCNMNCEYCFYRDVAQNRTVPSYGVMSLETLETLVEKALRFADHTCTFAFQGGEPTLAGLPFFETLLELEKKHNPKNVRIFHSIQTNGYDVSEPFARFFAQNRFLVGLSLDGGRAAHDRLRVDRAGDGTFGRVMNTAGLFDRHRVEYNILCVVHQYNARHGTQLYTFFKKSGFRFLQFIPCIDRFDGERQEYSLSPARYGSFLKTVFDHYYADYQSGNYTSVRNFENYINVLAGHPAECCGMSGVCNHNFVIEADGSAYPCDFYVLDRRKTGEIRNDTLEEIAESAAAAEFVRQSDFIDPKCARCEWFFLCRGGCRRYREPFFDGKPSLHRYCESFCDFFGYAYDRMRRIARGIPARHDPNANQ